MRVFSPGPMNNLIILNHDVHIEAPATVQVAPKTTTSVDVVMTTSEKNTDVSFYEAGYQRQFCSVPGGASPLVCSIGGLSAGTRYNVYAMACMAGFECSYRKFAAGYTFPDGMQLQHFC